MFLNTLEIKKKIAKLMVATFCYMVLWMINLCGSLYSFYILVYMKMFRVHVYNERMIKIHVKK